VRDVAALYPEFTTKVVNSSGWRHTEITSGVIRFTVHAVENPCAMVDRSEYRDTLAESQSSFFDPALFIPDAKLYALLLHGPYPGRDRSELRQYRYLTGSVYLAFPETALKGYAHKVDLFERYPELLDELLPKEWDSRARLSYRQYAKQRTA
jgi:hypothetical protein